jgi:hypothetical protein
LPRLLSHPHEPPLEELEEEDEEKEAEKPPELLLLLLLLPPDDELDEEPLPDDTHTDLLSLLSQLHEPPPLLLPLRPQGNDPPNPPHLPRSRVRRQQRVRRLRRPGDPHRLKAAATAAFSSSGAAADACTLAAAWGAKDRQRRLHYH